MSSFLPWTVIPTRSGLVCLGGQSLEHAGTEEVLEIHLLNGEINDGQLFLYYE